MKSKHTVIMIPARYGSTRFPGKPLEKIAGISMLRHVFNIAEKAAKSLKDVVVYITTDDKRISHHALTFTQNVIMTKSACLTGSSRVFSAALQLERRPDILINLQGDLPLLPSFFINKLIIALSESSDVDVATPVTQLSWQALNEFREWKKTHPFSGTTVVVNKAQEALWFSKNIIPAIRNESALQDLSALSPVYRHIGLYGYQYKALEKFMDLEEAVYEKLEGLEQLRLIENGLKIKTVPVQYGDLPSMSGVDTPGDLELAEELFLKNRELIDA
jgi:3-deoxy-manno-octulosonate cytidylyltransferase (CMP-KDO synthetase)